MVEVLTPLAAILGTLGTLATLSKSVRLRRRCEGMVELATRFDPGSHASRALRVAARNLACELAARELVRGRWIWPVATITMTGLAILLLGFWGARSTVGAPVVQTVCIVPSILLMGYVLYRASCVTRAITDALVEDGWYLDLAEGDAVTVDLAQDRFTFRRGRLPLQGDASATPRIREKFRDLTLPRRVGPDWLSVDRFEDLRRRLNHGRD